MKKHKIGIKKFGNTHAIWFQQSKSFLLLEEPAFDVFKNYFAGVDAEKITEICQQKYGHLEENIPQFVDEIIQLIDYYNNPENSDELSSKSLLPNTIEADSFLPQVNYKIGDKQISVLYDSEYLKFAIHPLITHLVTNNRGSTKHVIECFKSGDLLVAKYNGQVIIAFHPSKIEYFIGGIRQLMYSILFDRDYYDWMNMLHASGITSGNRAILFSAAAGSGKSTISAILKAKGYGFLGDDFIACDTHGNAYPFPSAISIKSGSIKTLAEFYPRLTETKSVQTFIGKTVKYIPVFNISKELGNGVPVVAFVFVEFSKTGEFGISLIIGLV